RARPRSSRDARQRRGRGRLRAARPPGLRLQALPDERDAQRRGAERPDDAACPGGAGRSLARRRHLRVAAGAGHGRPPARRVRHAGRRPPLLPHRADRARRRADDPRGAAAHRLPGPVPEPRPRRPPGPRRAPPALPAVGGGDRRPPPPRRRRRGRVAPQPAVVRGGGTVGALPRVRRVPVPGHGVGAPAQADARLERSGARGGAVADDRVRPLQAGAGRHPLPGGRPTAAAGAARAERPRAGPGGSRRSRGRFAGRAPDRRRVGRCPAEAGRRGRIGGCGERAGPPPATGTVPAPAARPRPGQAGPGDRPERRAGAPLRTGRLATDDRAAGAADPRPHVTPRREGSEVSDGFLVLPFYAVSDESSSMADEVDTVNTSLKELHSEIVTQPVIADKTRFALIGFSTEARELLRLSDRSTVSSMPGIVADGLTAYGRVFSLLRDVIERDVRNLKNDGLPVYRPTVFFLSDGLPTDPDEWPEEHARLVDQSWTYRPNIIAFGIGQADAQTIGQVATLKAYMVNDGVNPAAALQEWARSLTKSIVASASATEDGQVRLVVPPPPEGFTEVQLDEL